MRGRAGWWSHGVRRALAAVLAAVASAAALSVARPVAASEAPDAGNTEDSGGIVAAAGRIPLTMLSVDGRQLFVSSALRRGYLLRLGTDRTGFRNIDVFDLERGTRITRQSLDPPGYADPHRHGAVGEEYVLGGDKVMVVDDAGGRLLMATQHRSQLGSAADAGRYVGSEVSTAARGRVCGQVNSNDQLMCLNGVSVLDARTLELIDHIPLQSLRVDGGLAAPQLFAMSFAPADAGRPARVHMVVQDFVHAPGLVQMANSSASPRNVGVPTYLVQFDIDAGRQDWAIRLDTCRGSRAGQNFAHMQDTAGIERQAAVFASRRPDDHAVYVACLTNSFAQTVGVVRVPLDEGGTPLGATVAIPDNDDLDGGGGAELADVEPQRPMTVEGPDQIYEMLADPESGRFAVQVLDGRPLAQVWWVFDTAVMQFIGTVGIGGPADFGSTLSNLSADTGRLYVFGHEHSQGGRTFPGGLFVADIRRTPVAQALHYPELAGLAPGGYGIKKYRRALALQTLPEGGTRVWYPDRHSVEQQTALLAIDDLRPDDGPAPALDFEGRTLDLDEAEGVTSASLDGAARGYGLRVLLVGGAEAATRAGPVDPVGTVLQCNDDSWGTAKDPAHEVAGGDAGGAFNLLRDDGKTVKQGGPCYRAGKFIPAGCVQGNREVVFAAVGPDGPAVVDATGARGAARPLMIDSITEADVSTPASRCTAADWDAVWSRALFGRAPVGEPRGPQVSDGLLAQCVGGVDDGGDQVGDPVSDGYRAEVRCEDENASGHAYLRGGVVEGVSVAEALSSFRIYRDPGRGVVARVESVARGVDLEGQARIDTVRGVAESWANGRRQPVAREEREQDYDPNCDLERTAGTCFQRHLFGLRTPGYSCGPCGDEQAFVRALNAIFNPSAMVRLREPDERLRIGAENGFAAAVQKPEHERFADLVLNSDLLQTVLPTLEFVRFAAPYRSFSRVGPRGRQIYQFAGVEVSSSYGIQCLLDYDPESNVCGAPAQESGSVTVRLVDGEGQPLAGGGFELRHDADGDGTLGLDDALAPEGACLTGADGVGTCVWEGLAPGSYLVTQVLAPPGYGRYPEPFPVALEPAESRLVTFTNVSDLSTVDVTAVDAAGEPVTGARFAAYPDPDGDGRVREAEEPAAVCETDAHGRCRMVVPVGSYVLVQTHAPGGLQLVEPVAFGFAAGGQVAEVAVVNTHQVPAEAPPATMIERQPGVGPPPPINELDGTRASPDGGPDELRPSVAERAGGTVTRLIRAPGDAMRLLVRSPQEALAWIVSAFLMVTAGASVARRRRLGALRGGVR